MSSLVISRRGLLVSAAAVCTAGLLPTPAHADSTAPALATAWQLSSDWGYPRGASGRLSCSCSACRKHAAAKVFSSSASAADSGLRAHPGCLCVVEPLQITQEQYSALFGAGAQVVDRRTSTVAAVLRPTTAAGIGPATPAGPATPDRPATPVGPPAHVALAASTARPSTPGAPAGRAAAVGVDAVQPSAGGQAGAGRSTTALSGPGRPEVARNNPTAHPTGLPWLLSGGLAALGAYTVRRRAVSQTRRPAGLEAAAAVHVS